MKKLIAITGLVLLAGLGAQASAADRTNAGVVQASNEDRAAAPRSDWMTVAQITEKYTTAGYQVRNIKTDSRGYELYAIDKDGNRIEVYLDPTTGEITGDAD